eukprot:s1572_g22.t1
MRFLPSSGAILGAGIRSPVAEPAISGTETGTSPAMTGCSNFFKIELLWPEQIATSKWFPPCAYVIFNCILAVVFVVFQLENLADAIPDIGGFYFIYLTNWALLLETITMAPLFVRYTVAFWYIIQPVSLTVVVLYWTLVNPIWEGPVGVDFTNLWAHFLNWLCLLISLFASHIPWSFKNFIWGLCFLLTYLAYTVIHFLAEIGTPNGCELYIDAECPIYEAFDWNMPMMTTIITVIALVAYTVFAGLYTGFFRCRNCCSCGAKPTGEVESKDEAEKTETIENAA